MAEVKNIDTAINCIETSIGSLSYDYLVIATGTKTNFFGNKSIEVNSMPMKTIPQALDIRSLILQNIEEADLTDSYIERKRKLNFVIAGAGPTGVELAGALAEFRRGILKYDYPELDENEMQVHLVEGSSKVLAAMSEQASTKAYKFLTNLGVKIHLNTIVKNYDGKTVFSENENFESSTFIWAAGVTGAPINGIDGDSLVERANRYRVDNFNKIDGFENIYALGDIALMTTKNFPKGHPQVAQPAIQQGKRLGKNFIKMLANIKMEPFTYFDKGTMATIGRNKAVCDLKNMHFAGAFAWFLWMFVHLWFLVGFRFRVITFFNWTYSYINYDRAAGLIIRPFRNN